MSQTYKYSYKIGESLLRSLSVYNVGYQKCEPGYQWGPGIRDHYCIHHIRSGKGTYVVEGEVYQLGKGDTFILYPGSEVRYFADESDPWEYAWVGFMGAEADAMVGATVFQREQPVVECNKIATEGIVTYLEEIDQVRGTNYKAETAMTGRLYLLLSIFIENKGQVEQKQGLQQMYVRRAKDYIASSYSYPITIEDVAAYAGISRSYLFRAFQTYQKQSPKEYLTAYRIRQACRLLKETQLSIAAVAYSVGFEDNLYFSKAFKKQMKVSPSQYRKE